MLSNKLGMKRRSPFFPKEKVCLSETYERKKELVPQSSAYGQQSSEQLYQPCAVTNFDLHSSAQNFLHQKKKSKYIKSLQNLSSLSLEKIRDEVQQPENPNPYANTTEFIKVQIPLQELGPLDPATQQVLHSPSSKENSTMRLSQWNSWESASKENSEVERIAPCRSQPTLKEILQYNYTHFERFGSGDFGPRKKSPPTQWRTTMKGHHSSLAHRPNLPG